MEKGATLACVDKLGGFLSLTLCDKANFDPLQQVKYDGIEKMWNRKEMSGLSYFSWYKSLNNACMPYILKTLLKIKSLLSFLANGRACWDLVSMIKWSDKGETLLSRMAGLFVQLSPWWPLAMLLVWKSLYCSDCTIKLANHYMGPHREWSICSEWRSLSVYCWMDGLSYKYQRPSSVCSRDPGQPTNYIHWLWLMTRQTKEIRDGVGWGWVVDYRITGGE